MSAGSAAYRTIALFGSSRCTPDHEDWKTAYRLGRLMGERHWTAINGGYGGVMEAVSRGVVDSGGEAIGVLIEAYGARGNRWLTERIVMPDLFARVRTLIDKADAYIVLPGSTGTLVELALVWELLNKGILADRPLICMGEFWRPVVDRLSGEPVRDSRLSAQPAHRFAGDRIEFCENPDSAIDRLARTWD